MVAGDNALGNYLKRQISKKGSMIAKGGFGKVYKVKMADGTWIAVAGVLVCCVRILKNWEDVGVFFFFLMFGSHHHSQCSLHHDKHPTLTYTLTRPRTHRVDNCAQGGGRRRPWCGDGLSSRGLGADQADLGRHCPPRFQPYDFMCSCVFVCSCVWG